MRSGEENAGWVSGLLQDGIWAEVEGEVKERGVSGLLGTLSLSGRQSVVL